MAKKGNILKRILIVLFLIIILLAGFLYNRYQIAPDISFSEVVVQDLNQNSISLDNYIGKPLVINYWGTWCPPCVKELPCFEKVKQIHDTDVQFVMISDESIEKITSFSNKNSYSFEFIRSLKKLSDYGVYSIPTTYFYNAEGNLVSSHTGELNIETLTSFIKKIQ
ncbi:TlpA disulfide reductase family protein [Aquimarina sp. 2201CG5-10]|uniref:TlpA family protein disulfide reductase n=1 Tax=Aquimarina callyspongiae TaxID=3098150 RepID=UPI002AB49080|nr:TlpA disulfide reductase family protein [Aquimarina sp. 2201CG5-10]MDY8135862.1 TlpA disulfide reductase family protein [Aquimarina sp. 2201CG5-10]